MIKLIALSIFEFRGIRELHLKISGGNFAICGPNGTGKSGIVDAIDFALTGNVSRLAGRGMGDVTLKEHAPHVDSRNRPDKARVSVTLELVSTGQQFSIERTVKSPQKPLLLPATSEISKLVTALEQHPEFALSRREIIKYVIATPGDRSIEIQSLLKLEKIGTTRSLLQKIARAKEKEADSAERDRQTAQRRLAEALQIPDLTETAVLSAVNKQRAVLSLPPIPALTATVSFRDGLETTVERRDSPIISKKNALEDIEKALNLHKLLSADAWQKTLQTTIEALAVIERLPELADGLRKEELLNIAISLVDDEHCPVCDTEWNPEELREVILSKLRALEAAAGKRREIELQLGPIKSTLSSAINILTAISSHASQLKTATKADATAKLIVSLPEMVTALSDFVPVAKAKDALSALKDVTIPVVEIEDIRASVAEIPDLTDKENARDWLTVAQERLETYRHARRQCQTINAELKIARDVETAYNGATAAVLNALYESVENDFASLYRDINRDDESEFSAKLTPSTGKVGFDVDFYGRGLFPPGAYHSEGHQDAMGLCLYLALMRHLAGENFTFAVLDDVLMSVDVGHRREVCNLLKREFPNTQFILTTHDPVWLKLMNTVGLVSSKSSIHFRKWTVDSGPTEWDDRDVWQEIDDSVKSGDIRSAAALLRHYLEFFFREACHNLRARVEFRLDSRFELGELSEAASARIRQILKEAKDVAISWGKKEEAQAIAVRENAFAELAKASQIDSWQINPAVHYNEWANFSAGDFTPVVDSFKALVSEFSCKICHAPYYIVPEQGLRQGIRCSCGTTNFNLVKKKSN